MEAKTKRPNADELEESGRTDFKLTAKCLVIDYGSAVSGCLKVTQEAGALHSVIRNPPSHPHSTHTCKISNLQHIAVPFTTKSFFEQLLCDKI